MKKESGTRRRSPFSHLSELFEASALGVVTLLLLLASFFATWRGMRDFIVSYEMAVSPTSKGLVFMIVATLSLALYVALREMISPYYVYSWFSAIWKRCVAFLLYAVLAFWSVGFGYGFWWSLVAGQDATEAGLVRTVDAIGSETNDMRARLAAAGSVMASAEALSDLKAQQEAVSGGTCGVNSPPGAGPLARARNETQAQIATLSASVRDDWQRPMNARLAELERDLASAMDGLAPGISRKEGFETLARKTQSAATEIGATATARGRTIAAQLRAKAQQLSVPPDSGRVSYCYDRDLAARLTTAADELAQAYEIQVPAFRYAEGADGVAQAIEGLFESAARQVGADLGVTKARGLIEGRSLIALMAAVGVDLALFIFALLRGGAGRRSIYSLDDGGPSGEAEVIDVTPEPVPALPQTRKALPRPRSPASRSGTNPSAVGITSSDAESYSQERDEVQVDDLIQSVDGLYRVTSIDKKHTHKDAEIARLNAELNRLKQLGYTPTGRPGQMFDAALHKAVERKASDQPENTIIATFRPGFLLNGTTLFRIAEVVVSAGPRPFDYDD